MKNIFLLSENSSTVVNEIKRSAVDLLVVTMQLNLSWLSEFLEN